MPDIPFEAPEITKALTLVVALHEKSDSVKMESFAGLSLSLDDIEVSYEWKHTDDIMSLDFSIRQYQSTIIRTVFHHRMFEYDMTVPMFHHHTSTFQNKFSSLIDDALAEQCYIKEMLASMALYVMSTTVNIQLSTTNYIQDMEDSCT